MRASAEALREILRDQQPLTVRGAYYQAVVHGLVQKTEDGYAQVQRDLLAMRRAGELPYHWIVDGTRWQRKPRSYTSLADCLNNAARYYRRDLWADSGVYVEIWCEKDALSGVLYDVTSRYDVPLMASRGQSSETFLYSAGEAIEAQGKTTFIYILSDFDGAGESIFRKIEEGLHRHAPTTTIYCDRLAVTESQISVYNLPTRPPKSCDKKKFDYCVELDAIPASILRAMTEQMILRHVDQRKLELLETVEASERQALRLWADQIEAGEENQ